jgi:hypothetical protein
MEMDRGAVAGEAEANSAAEVCQTLGEKKQFERQALGDKPLSVILCKSVTEYERIFEKGVEAGNGTKVQQRTFRKLLDGWEVAARRLSEEQLRLSSRTHFVYLPDCGHNVHLIRPDVVAEEIRWVLGMIRGRDVQKL